MQDSPTLDQLIADYKQWDVAAQPQRAKDLLKPASRA